MNNNCAANTVRQLKDSASYRQIERGTIGPDVKTKSRCNKAELCRFLKIRGVGLVCHQTREQIRHSHAFQNLPPLVKRQARRKLEMCEAIARPTILVLRLIPNADPTSALSNTSIPRTMNQLCRFRDAKDNFDIKEVIFDNKRSLKQAIASCGDNTIGAIIIISHGNINSITVGIRQSLDGSRVNELHIARKLMEGAQVLLMSCSTGSTSNRELKKYGRETPIDRRLGKISFHNSPIKNFANHLAQSIPGHVVIATPNAQQCGTWSMRKKSRDSYCGTDQEDPLPYVFNIDNQKLYYFSHD